MKFTNFIQKPQVRIKKEEDLSDDVKMELLGNLPKLELPAEATPAFVSRWYTRLGISWGFGGSVQECTVPLDMGDGHTTTAEFLKRDMNPQLPGRPGLHALVVDLDRDDNSEVFRLITKDDCKPPAKWNYKGDYRRRQITQLSAESWRAQHANVRMQASPLCKIIILYCPVPK